jgi:hypothetical protein
MISGTAANMFAATTFEVEGSAPAADSVRSERFLQAYERARRIRWSRDHWEVAWSASVWVACYQVQLSVLEAVTGAFAALVRRDLPERLCLTGLKHLCRPGGGARPPTPMADGVSICLAAVSSWFSGEALARAVASAEQGAVSVSGGG